MPYASGGNEIAGKRAQTLITAVNSFKEKYHQYPVKLEELTPEFIERVPKAKYSLMYNSFIYFSNPDSHQLLFYSMPPYGRPVYSFERNEWIDID